MYTACGQSLVDEVHAKEMQYHAPEHEIRERSGQHSSQLDIIPGIISKIV